MATTSLTGSRIRERRSIVGVKQADLARSVGISASYLNLIEHNRRRIGGKLLLDIAATLGVDAAALTTGAEAALIASLRDAADGARIADSELDRAEEFAGRFPGWAEVLTNAHRRINALERTVETLNDRMAHDPLVAASVHEVLSTAAAIRSTASILAEDKTITEEWRNRFHTNIDQDSRRLAESSKALVGYLESTEHALDAQAVSSPQDELNAFLEAHDYAFEGVEQNSQTIDDVMAQAPQLVSNAAKHLARAALERLQLDAQRVSLDSLRPRLDERGVDPLMLAQDFDVPVSLMLRRLAALPSLQAGLVVCDRAGSLVFRKPVAGFAIPRFGAACPLWPLFDVFAMPGQVARQPLQQLGRASAEFESFSVAETAANLSYNSAPLIQATMLIVPLGANADPVPLREVGSTCRVCVRRHCAGRREPSILSEGF